MTFKVGDEVIITCWWNSEEGKRTYVDDILARRLIRTKTPVRIEMIDTQTESECNITLVTLDGEFLEGEYSEREIAYKKIESWKKYLKKC
jgi:hypothetical protein